MIDIEKLFALQKQSKTSFASQRLLMKKVMAGQTVLCPTCQQPLYLLAPEHSDISKNENSGIYCQKGCTDIQLDFA